MKKVLIISPNFPPVNAPDMQRIRMSMPYYRSMGWEPVIICVDEKYVEGYRDPLLSETIPADIEIHRTKAWPTRITRKFGLGSLSLRSFFFIRKKGNDLLSREKYDLIFFSTTMFHVLALGPYWSKKFRVPFVVDMQDPWRNDFYLGRPKSVRPPKYRYAYEVHKRMEALTMPQANGIMSVSQGYIEVLKQRYPVLESCPAVVIPFGSSTDDFELVKRKQVEPMIIGRTPDKINVVYIGALLSQSFMPLLAAFFKAFKNKIADKDKYHFYFIGTNYSPHSQVKPIAQLADSLGLSDIISECPDRIPFFSALATLMHSSILFIPGSIDIDYNASKVCNNIIAGRPIFSIFNERSHVTEIITAADAGLVVGLSGKESEDELISAIENKMSAFASLHLRTTRIENKLPPKFLAQHSTQLQVDFFNLVCDNFSKRNSSTRA